MRNGEEVSKHYEKRTQVKQLNISLCEKRKKRRGNLSHREGREISELQEIRARNTRLPRSHRKMASSPMLPKVKSVLGRMKEDTESKTTQEREFEIMKETTEDDEEFNYFEGNRGLREFRSVIKSQKRLEELNNDYNRHQGNALIHYAKQAAKMNLIPYPTGLLRRYVPTPNPTKLTDRYNQTLDPKRLNNQHSISIPNFSIGEKYAKALSGTLKSIGNLQSLELGFNRLHNKGALPIITNMPSTIKVLDLSRNNLSLVSYKQISKIIADPQCQMIKLFLEKNNGGNQGCCCIAEGLLTNNSIVLLDLSSNNIGDIGAIGLAKSLKKHLHMNSVLLHWNKIGGIGGAKVFKALSSNNILQVLDLSFNSLGIGGGDTCALQLKNMFKKNISIVHMDLSHNSFNDQSALIISKGLRKNHTILGLHLLGNHATIDAKGFLHSERNNIPSISHIFCRINPKLEIGTLPNQEFHKLKALSNCWICEGWVQAYFEFIPQVTHKYKLGEFDNIYLHLSFEGYKPDLMLKDSKTGQWTKYRMVPPGHISYFYSINNENPFIDYKLPVQHMKDKYLQLEGFPKFTLPDMNMMNTEMIKGKIIDKKYLEKLKATPRPRQLKAQNQKRAKTPWSLPISIFWGYQGDNTDLLNKCFEHDWKHTKLSRFIKNVVEFEKVKELIRPFYKAIRESYKHFSGVDPTLGIFSISVNVSTDIFVHHAEIMDEHLDLKDLDLDFIQTTAGAPKGETNNPKHALIRNEYLELIVRLACRKYLSSSLVDSPYQAVSLFLKNHIIKAFDNEEYDCHHWRSTYLWNEECDIVLKKHRSLLKALYAKYSGRHTQPGKSKFMSLDELHDMVLTSDVFSEEFGAREINIHFALAMMTQVDEIHKTKHLEMNELEFIEALSRIAQKLTIVSPYQLEDDNFVVPCKEELQNYKLNVKINYFLETLLRKTMSQEFVEHYEKNVLGRISEGNQISKLFLIGTEKIRKVSNVSGMKSRQETRAGKSRADSRQNYGRVNKQ